MVATHLACRGFEKGAAGKTGAPRAIGDSTDATETCLEWLPVVGAYAGGARKVSSAGRRGSVVL